MNIQLKNILPNPNRDLKFNPLDQVKVDALFASINDTGFWDNVVVRKSPTTTGKYEQAYGHQRLEAAKKAGLTEADFIVKELSDEDMIKIMARENDDAYRYSIMSLLEKVKAVVIGLAEGRVKPFDISDKVKTSSIMYAPSYTPGLSSCSKQDHMRYTTSSVARFLGMFSVKKEDQSILPHHSVIAALGALRLIQSGHMTEESIRHFGVNELYKQVRITEGRKEVTREREQQKAQQEAERRKSEAQRAAEAKAEAERAQAVLNKIAAQKAKVLTEKLAAQRQQELDDAKAKADLAKTKAEEAKRDWDAGEAERKKAKLAKERAAVQETARKEATRASHVKTVIGKIERIMLEDAIYDLIKDLKRTTALTPTERNNLKTALQDAAQRFKEEASKF
jgi:ParB/RepB/Spo0J family partition protein